MKQQTAPLPQSYHAIHDFFDAFALPAARNYLLHAVLAAESDHIYNQTNPANLLYFFDQLDGLVCAAYRLNRQPAVVCSGAPDVLQFNLYCGSNKRYGAFDYFPRVLSAEEFADPFLAVERFTGGASKRVWRERLVEIRDAALGGESLIDWGSEIKVLGGFMGLMEMIEACYLIGLRVR